MLLGALVCLGIVTGVMVHSKQVYAVAWNLIGQNEQTEIENYDNTVVNPASPCSNSQKPQPYYEDVISWMSDSNNTGVDSTSGLSVPYGATNPSVNIAFNNLIFLCHFATANDHDTGGNNILTPTNAPLDVPPGVSNYNQPLPSLPSYAPGDYLSESTAYKVDNVTTSCQVITGPLAGTSCPAGSTTNLNPYSFEIDFQSNTRYWFPTGGVKIFSYTGGGTVTQQEQITVTVTEKALNTFVDSSGKVHYVCVAGAVDITNTYGDNINYCQDNAPVNYGVVLKPTPVGTINGIHVDATSGASLGSGFSPTVSVNDPANDSATGNPFSFANPITTGTYNVSVPSTYSYNGTTYTVQGSYWCDSTSPCNPLPGTNNPYGSNYSAGNTATVTVADGSDIQMRWTWKASPGIIASSPCPNWQTQGNEPSNLTAIPISLSNTAMPSPPSGTSGSSGQSGSATTASQQYYQYTPQNNFEINSAQDQYSSPTSINTNSPINTWQGSANFTLDYTNYITQYPYDPHNTTIGYTQDWTQTNWYTSSSPDFYTCNAGDTLSGTTCTHTNNFSGTEYCAVYESDGVTCQTEACTPQGSPTSNPPCSYSTTSTYDATANYDWHEGSSSTVTNTGTNNSAPAMPECYYRAFTVTNVTASPSLDSYEDPSTGYSQGTVDVQFSYPANGPQGVGLQNPMEVKLNWDRTVLYCNSGTDVSTGNTTLIIGRYAPSTVTGAALDTPEFSCTFTAPPHNAGDSICSTYIVSPTGDAMDWQGNVVPPGGNGGTMQNNPAPTCSSQVVDMPYAQFFGGDAIAGGAFANGSDACNNGENQLNPGNLMAYFRDSNALTRGSGDQFAAIANGGISGFASATIRPAGDYPVAAPGLMFANAGTGGNFGSNLCTPDYSATQPTSATNWSSPNLNMDPYGASTATPTSTALTDTTGNLVIDSSAAGRKIGTGQHIAIYVTGHDVYIENNIQFAGATTGWSDTDHIPSFYLVVKGGNIYIAPGVTQLDGVYVSQPSGGNGGNIDTCAPGFSSYGSPSELYGPCNSQLTVNGSFIAQKVKLNRTFSSLRNSIGGEYPASPATDCGPGDKGPVTRSPASTTYDCAAEVFNTTPDIFLGTPAIQPTNPNGEKYDYVTSVSPVF